jgi:hypothetical protein
MMSALQAIKRPVRSVQRRLSAQRLLRVASLSAGAMAAVAALGLLALKLAMLPVGLFAPLLLTCAALPLLCAAVAWAWPTSQLGAARRLDDTNQLQSRLSSALEFAQVAEPSDFMLAAISDAARVAPTARPALAAPFVWPRELLVLAVGGALLGGAWTVWPTLEAGPLPVWSSAALSPPKVPRGAVSPETEQALLEAEAALRELAAQNEGEASAEERDLQQELKELLAELRSGEASPEDALRALAELEARLRELDAQRAAELEMAEQRLREASQALAKGAGTEELKDALERGDMERAAAALEQLGRQKMSASSRDKLAKQLEKMAETLANQEEERAKQLAQEIDRLKKQIEERKQDRLTPKEKDRLAKDKKRLESLERKREQRDAEAQKSLQRLERKLRDAAHDMQRRNPEEQRQQEAMKRAADELRRLSEQERQARQRAQTARMAEDLREMVRRMGRQQRRPGGGQPEPGSEPGEQRRMSERSFSERAEQGLGPADAGEAERMRLRAGAGQPRPGGEGRGEQGQGEPGEGQGQSPGQGEQAGQGDKPGQDPDPGPTLGEKTDMAAKSTDEQVQGRKGKGPSRGEIIQTSGRAGFASTAWREVHEDYSDIVEEDMEREQLPPGYRKYVQKYFDLIRPREALKK